MCTIHTNFSSSSFNDLRFEITDLVLPNPETHARTHTLHTYGPVFASTRARTPISTHARAYAHNYIRAQRARTPHQHIHVHILTTHRRLCKLAIICTHTHISIYTNRRTWVYRHASPHANERTHTYTRATRMSVDIVYTQTYSCTRACAPLVCARIDVKVITYMYTYTQTCTYAHNNVHTCTYAHGNARKHVAHTHFTRNICTPKCALAHACWQGTSTTVKSELGESMQIVSEAEPTTCCSNLICAFHSTKSISR